MLRTRDEREKLITSSPHHRPAFFLAISSDASRSRIMHRVALKVLQIRIVRILLRQDRPIDFVQKVLPSCSSVALGSDSGSAAETPPSRHADFSTPRALTRSVELRRAARRCKPGWDRSIHHIIGSLSASVSSSSSPSYFSSSVSRPPSPPPHLKPLPFSIQFYLF